jgi:hypothetical protein
MKKSVIFNYNSLRKTAGGAMPIFDYSKPFLERQEEQIGG